jgi:hypothetical protein
MKVFGVRSVCPCNVDTANVSTILSMAAPEAPSVWLTGEEEETTLPPALALASRILFSTLFDRFDRETLGHGHHFAGLATGPRCAVRLLVNAGAGLEALRAGFAGRERELSDGILEATALKLFPFFTLEHLAEMRRFAVGTKATPAATRLGLPPPTSPMRPKQFPSEPTTATARVELNLAPDGATPTPGGGLDGRPSGEHSVLHQEIRVPHALFTEVDYRVPGRPPARFATDATGEVQLRSGLVFHTRMIPCTERVVLLGQTGLAPAALTGHPASNPSKTPSLRSGSLATPSLRSASLHPSSSSPEPASIAARFEVPMRMFMIRRAAVFESIAELFPGVTATPPRPEFVGIRCETPARSPRFMLLLYEPGRTVARSMPLIRLPGTAHWEVKGGGALDMRGFARVSLVVEAEGPMQPAPGQVLPDMVVHVCALGRLLRIA